MRTLTRSLRDIVCWIKIFEVLAGKPDHPLQAAVVNSSSQVSDESELREKEILECDTDMW